MASRPKTQDKARASHPASGPVPSAIPEGDRLRLLDHVEGGIAVYHDDAFLYANEPLLRMLGSPSLEVLALKKVSDVVTVGAGHRQSWRCADGSVLEVDVTVSTMSVDGTSVDVALVTDPSATLRAQAHMQQTERLATIGTLAAGIAHQLNNPLAYLMANVNFLAEEIPPFLRSLSPTVSHEQAAQLNDLLGAMADAREGAERVARIVRDLRTLSRMEDDRSELIDVQALLDSAALLADSELKPRAQLVKHYDTVMPVEGNPSRVAQLFVNLVMNAAQAIQTGDAQKNEVMLRSYMDPQDGMVTVEVVDTGVGMPPAVVSRIFDPFYTLKPVGQGTGLGLTTCLAIVDHMHGSITVESEEGHGTLVRVKLPPALRSSRRERAPDPAKTEHQTKRRMLIVDDELTLLSSLRRALAREVDVSVASSAAEALAIFEKDRRFDLVLCDIMMPDVNGMELFERVVKAYPELRERFVFMTGGTYPSAVQQLIATANAPILEKPFDVRDLRRLLKKLT